MFGLNKNSLLLSFFRCNFSHYDLLIQLFLFTTQIAFLAAKGDGIQDGDRDRSGVDSGRPVFRSTPQNVTVTVGERAVLRCRVDNLGTRTVTWRRQGETHPLTIGLFTFAPDPRISVDFNQRTNEWSLIIPEVRSQDEGIYHCQVTVKISPLQNSFDVRLNVKTIQLSGTEYVERGNPIHLLCNATGKPDTPSNIEWYFEGQPLYSDVSSGLLITTKIESQVLFGKVLIENSDLRHQGVYDCRTSNGDVASMTVHVLNGISAERIIGDEEEAGINSQVRGSAAATISSSSSSLSSSLLLRLFVGILALLSFL